MEIYQGDLSGEKILVQGIIDVYFEEEDGLVVLDYKTDQVKAEKNLRKNIMRSLNIMHMPCLSLREKL